MATREPLAVDEWYHCFNRGVDKRRIFEDESDCDRFLSLMYVCNGNKNIQIGDRHRTDLRSILEDSAIDRGEPLVDIGAYALMPNHVHFAFKQIRGHGISIFMQKVCTGYTMYFNKKYERAGALFSGPFKSKHVYSDEYLKHVISYIVLNPAELFEPEWKRGVADVERLGRKLMTYPYSSFPDFFGMKRLEAQLLGDSLSEYYDVRPRLKQALRDALLYYRELTPKVRQKFA